MYCLLRLATISDNLNLMALLLQVFGKRFVLRGYVLDDLCFLSMIYFSRTMTTNGDPLRLTTHQLPVECPPIVLACEL